MDQEAACAFFKGISVLSSNSENLFFIPRGDGMFNRYCYEKAKKIFLEVAF